MAENDDHEGLNPSGLSHATIETLLAELMRDLRVARSTRAARENLGADIGFSIKSRQKFFFAGPNEPVVPGFEPGLILEGDWDSESILTKSDAPLADSPNGFVAACVVNLAAVPDARQFFRELLSQFGPIEIAPQFTPDLARSVPFIKADQKTLAEPPVSADYDGRGVTVCVVDMGCDFAHRNFRVGKNATDRALLRSRIKFLINMDAAGGFDAIAQADIERWIAERSPYDAARNDPNHPYDPHSLNNNCVAPDPDGTHGTLVMDIAAGNGNGTGVKGVAPAADLCFVQVFVSKTGGRKYIDGASTFNAVKRALQVLNVDTPNGAPTVFNISLGTHDGPHDSKDHGNVPPGGSEKAWNLRLDRLFDAKNGRAVVWSAGNQGRTSAHAVGRVRPNAPATFDIRIPEGDRRENVVKIWFDKPNNVTVTCQAKLLDYRRAPSTYGPTWQAGALEDDAWRWAGHLDAPAQYGSASDLYFIQGSLMPPVRRTPSAEADRDRWETWRIEVSGSSAAAFDFRLDAWIERDDGDQAQFLAPAMPSGAASNTRIEAQGSLSAAAAGVASATVVGAVAAATYVPGTPVDGPGIGQALPFSSAGPDRLGDKRPHVCAPGELVSGAKSRGDPVAMGAGYGRAATTAMSGTSMAAPHVAGLVALLFDKKNRQGAAYPAGYPTSVEAREALIDAARPNIPGAAVQWEPQRGYGCVDAVNLLK